jgi:7-carboxy-7-deazaguanine synthase
MTLRIAEIFASIQGEGRWLGVPSTFVRVSGCNLRCIWCDTPYASWSPEGPVMEVSAIVDEVVQLGHRHVVLTGGEPMLFEAIEPLCVALHQLGHVLTIETAGTVYRELPADLMSISPKLSNSTPPEASGWQERHETTRQDREPLAQLVAKYDYQLKFVIIGPSDVEEIDELLNDLPGIAADAIYLMAEGVEPAALRERQRALVRLCMERGWRLAPRLHIDLFGDAKGT